MGNNLSDLVNKAAVGVPYTGNEKSTSKTVINQTNIGKPTILKHSLSGEYFGTPSVLKEGADLEKNKNFNFRR